MRRPMRSTRLDALVTTEPVQLVQELKHCPLHFTVTGFLGVKPLGTNGIQLVDKDNCGRLLFCQLECVPDEFRAVTDEHLHQGWACELQVACVCLCCAGTREEGFAGT